MSSILTNIFGIVAALLVLWSVLGFPIPGGKAKRPKLRLVKRTDVDYKGWKVIWEIQVEKYPGHFEVTYVPQCVGTYLMIPARFTDEETALRYLQELLEKLEYENRTVVTTVEVIKTV